jgi:glutamyl-Q tRNA(Asp) synthetase
MDVEHHAPSLACSVSPLARLMETSPYRGRFAPSPTGALHFGSLVAAVGSYLQARACNGRWLVRIEDLDPPREVPGAARDQLRTLRHFGLISDEPVTWQSRCKARHDQALALLLASASAFACGCSRADLPASGIYPGTCRTGIAPGKQPRSIRLKTDDRDIHFEDAVRGSCIQNPGQQTGDFVIRRADGLIAYQLAVVVEDDAAGITEVVRGADLLDSTARQLLVYQALDLPAPAYVHLPLVVDEHGRKLSKSEADDPVRNQHPQTALALALRALGHQPPAACRSLDSVWRWALMNWQIEQVPQGPVCIGVHPR